MYRIPVWLLALVWLVVCQASAAESFEGHVIQVSDGDTITVLKGKEQIRVRIAGIDAPERRQPYSVRSLEHLSGLVRRRVVTVDWYKKDRYGRLIGTVRLRGLDV